MPHTRELLLWLKHYYKIKRLNGNSYADYIVRELEIMLCAVQCKQCIFKNMELVNFLIPQQQKREHI